MAFTVFFWLLFVTSSIALFPLLAAAHLIATPFDRDRRLTHALLSRIAKEGGEEAAGFCTRFGEVYSKLDDDLRIFEQSLGPELWSWLSARPASFCRLPLKGKRASQYVDDPSSWDQLYEDGVDFQTNYDVTEAQIQNKLRRPEQLIEILQRRHADLDRVAAQRLTIGTDHVDAVLAIDEPVGAQRNREVEGRPDPEERLALAGIHRLAGTPEPLPFTAGSKPSER